MKRRDFIKKGTIAFALTASGGISFSFVPDESQVGDEFNHCIPFRKPARNIKEHIPGFLWADAADFQDYGGWALDTQHVGFMGSSYLLAHGTSQTVKDASLKINNVRPGKYRLWVRSRNWMQEYAPGQFGIRITGKDSGAVFGAQKEEGWSWQDGGVHEIKGSVTLELQDKTGQFGRCSSVILTRELNYKPPVEVEAFKQERARLSGVSDAIVPLGDYDVVVVGAGVSGCCAALAAAREGANVALVSDRPVLGGNASEEIGVPVQGAANHQGLARETGIIEEAGRLGKASRWGRVMSKPFEALIGEEQNLTLIQNVWLEDVNMKGDRIHNAILRQTLTGERMKVSGNMFIDCSGDAWLGYHAGADFRRGREARSEHDEINAPDKADSLTMSGCLRGPKSNFKECIFYQTVKENMHQSYTAPPWIYKLPKNEWFTNGEGHYKRKTQHNQEEAINGTWWLEHPGDVDDLNDPEYARDQLIRVCHTLWDFWKNKWEEKDKIAPYWLAYIPFTVGKRETRRLMGDYILNQNDCVAGRHFPDAIGHYGWPLDLHAPMGIMDNNGRYYSDTRIPMGHIPYRCLYSRNVGNMLMAGRNVSVTHVALGTVRVEGQCSLMGQAAGTAAALAVRHKTTPRGIYEKHMAELQQVLLKNDQAIPKVANQDTRDLGQAATISASSEQGEASKPANVVNGFAHPVNEKETNMWESSPKETLPQWIELKLDKPAKVGAIQCTFDTDLNLSLASEKEALPSVCVRDYTIECHVDGQWKNRVSVRDNFQRFRRHQFGQVKTDRIRLTIEATHGAKTARVLEIRVYKDAKA
jgi:hypothetical protein